MTWADARTELLTLLEGVTGVSQALPIYPTSAEALYDGVSVILVPPARAGTRDPGGATRWTYSVPMVVLTLWASDPEGTSTAVDDVVEAINEALESAVLLSGRVTSSSAPSWEQASLLEFPPDSMIWFTQMAGTMELLMVRDYDREP